MTSRRWQKAKIRKKSTRSLRIPRSNTPWRLKIRTRRSMYLKGGGPGHYRRNRFLRGFGQSLDGHELPAKSQRLNPAARPDRIAGIKSAKGNGRRADFYRSSHPCPQFHLVSFGQILGSAFPAEPVLAGGCSDACSADWAACAAPVRRPTVQDDLSKDRDHSTRASAGLSPYCGPRRGCDSGGLSENRDAQPQ